MQLKESPSDATPTLIVALDMAEMRRALALRESLTGLVDYFKVGSEIFTAAGPSVVEELRRSGARVFLDLKFHDIPTTVGRAVAAASRLGVSLVDVHASGGLAMMKAAVEAARTVEEASRPLVFGVTLLTHIGDEDMEEIGLRRSGTGEQVVRLARLARESGLDGVVASAREVEVIREATHDALAVLVPGVRPDWAGNAHDQKRVATPGDVARAGARYVVVGRAISSHPNPREAAARVLEELASAAASSKR